MPELAIQPEVVERVNASYGACCISPGFFDDFYTIFLANVGPSREKFAHTDMDRQKSLLREGIAYLLMYAKGSKFVEGKLDQIGQIHSPSQHDIAPALYPIWVDSLMATIEKHDAKFNAQSRDEWKQVLEIGIQRIQSHY